MAAITGPPQVSSITRMLGVSVANLCDEAESARLRLRQLPLPFPPRADTREPYRFDR